jgi:hypothetical protein
MLACRHGVVFLPVCLSLFGPASYRKAEEAPPSSPGKVVEPSPSSSEEGSHIQGGASKSRQETPIEMVSV